MFSSSTLADEKAEAQNKQRQQQHPQSKKPSRLTGLKEGKFCSLAGLERKTPKELVADDYSAR